MALKNEVVGKCRKKIRGKVCKGNVVEHKISPNPDTMIVGPGQLSGYMCQKCKKEYTTPPVDLKKLRKLVIQTFEKYGPPEELLKEKFNPKPKGLNQRKNNRWVPRKIPNKRSKNNRP